MNDRQLDMFSLSVPCKKCGRDILGTDMDRSVSIREWSLERKDWVMFGPFHEECAKRHPK